MAESTQSQILQPLDEEDGGQKAKTPLSPRTSPVGTDNEVQTEDVSYNFLGTLPKTRKSQQVCCRLATFIKPISGCARSDRLLWLDDNKSVASCQQA